MNRKAQPAQRRDQDKLDANEQSGSTGRNPGTGDHREDGVNTGQGRYGMTGGDSQAARDGGGERGKGDFDRGAQERTDDANRPTPGHATGSSGTSEYGASDDPDTEKDDSNPGSGRADRDESKTKSKEPPKGPFKHRDDNENPG